MNQGKKIAIIGCGAGGGTAAQFARKTDRKAEITIFEKGKYSQYSKCGLPYVISGTIADFNNLIEFSEDWFKKANIDLHLETTVEKIDAKKKIIIAKKRNNVVEKSYDTLIIATGAKPFIPPIENVDVDGVFVVRTIDDVKNISSFIKKNGNATIVGAGLIGLEMTDNLRKKGMKITVVETLPMILANNLDEDMVKIVGERIPDDVKILTNHRVEKVESTNGKISKIVIKSQEKNEEITIDSDLLIIAAGTKPDIDLAKSIGCKIGKTGGIIVNKRCETSVQNVYAIGDCTEFVDYITAKPSLVGLGSIVVRQGISSGINAAGGDYELHKGVLNTSTSEFFGVEIAAVGPTTKGIEDIFSVVTGHFNGSSLPHYYPGGKPISVKILVDKYTGLIISAQAVGENAAQRINLFASAILGQLDIETLRKLETAYAPPIAPTLDVVTLVCDIVS
ncbi:MAG: FAD-dependent oxidoreductase, partial [Thermoplasmatales archaeon]|nr:FAD-dependent oxidoreductase [Thermoplasmatales archaeon]